MCSRCLTKPVAWASPRVDFCYDCLPGGPFVPPPCRGCGLTGITGGCYFSQGLCTRCHPAGQLNPGACKGCSAWGVLRRYNWTCWTCRTWRSHYSAGTCQYCGRAATVSDVGACRLCLEQARLLQEPGHPLDLIGASQHGHQLFFANMLPKRRPTPIAEPRRPRPATAPVMSAWRQETLFVMAPQPERVRHLALTENSDLTGYFQTVVRDHAITYGWSARQRTSVTHSLKLRQLTRTNPTTRIRASEVLELPRYAGTINSTLEVLQAAGLLIDDRTSPLTRYLHLQLDALPATMRSQLQLWLDARTSGSTTAPRQRLRKPSTIKTQMRSIGPILQVWADRGYESLAEVTTQDVQQGLAGRGAQAPVAQSALRSLFTFLKRRKLIFSNPTRGSRHSGHRTIPTTLDTAAIRAELHNPDPAIAVAVALVAFHALTRQQLAHLLLTDIRDGRLTIDGRTVPLAAPVRTRLAAWLDHRTRRWPGTLNPHLLINRKTAPRLRPIGPAYLWLGSTVRPQALREDRIVHEIHATGGDVRRLCDLFGLSISGATRYLATIEHPDLTHRPGTQVPRTSLPNKAKRQ